MDNSVPDENIGVSAKDNDVLMPPSITFWESSTASKTGVESRFDNIENGVVENHGTVSYILDSHYGEPGRISQNNGFNSRTSAEINWCTVMDNNVLNASNEIRSGHNDVLMPPSITFWESSTASKTGVESRFDNIENGAVENHGTVSYILDSHYGEPGRISQNNGFNSRTSAEINWCTVMDNNVLNASNEIRSGHNDVLMPPSITPWENSTASKPGVESGVEIIENDAIENRATVSYSDSLYAELDQVLDNNGFNSTTSGQSSNFSSTRSALTDVGAAASILPICCKDLFAELYKEKFGSSTGSKCVLFEHRWITLCEFESASGFLSRKWKRNIRFDGQPLQSLIDKGHLVPHDSKCVCRICVGNPSNSNTVMLFVPRRREQKNKSTPGVYVQTKPKELDSTTKPSAASVPATAATSVPATAATSVPATAATSVPATAATSVPATAATSVPATAATSVPATAATSVPASFTAFAPVSSATLVPASSATLAPASSATLVPASSATLAPASSATLVPALSATLAPASSATLVPASSATLTPVSSATCQLFVSFGTLIPVSAAALIPVLLANSAPVSSDTSALVSSDTSALASSATPAPLSSDTSVPVSSNISVVHVSSDASLPVLSATLVPLPSDTSVPVSDTSVPVSDTSVPVPDTSVPVSDTSVPVSDTSAPVPSTTSLPILSATSLPVSSAAAKPLSSIGDAFNPIVEALTKIKQISRLPDSQDAWKVVEDSVEDIVKTAISVRALVHKMKESANQKPAQNYVHAEPVVDYPKAGPRRAITDTNHPKQSQTQSFIPEKSAKCTDPNSTIAIPCKFCGQDGSLECTGCRIVHYCTIRCQHKDWPRHQITCTSKLY